ncbi:MAG: OadG family protein [Christensenellales bacterium]|jgi:hypothetical protein
MGGLDLGWIVALIAAVIIVILLVSLSKAKSNKNKEQGNPGTNVLHPTVQHAAAADDAELIAVITAAVNMMMATSPKSDGLIVRSVKRIQQNTPAWNQAGRNDQLFYRF